MHFSNCKKSGPPIICRPYIGCSLVSLMASPQLNTEHWIYLLLAAKRWIGEKLLWTNCRSVNYNEVTVYIPSVCVVYLLGNFLCFLLNIIAGLFFSTPPLRLVNKDDHKVTQLQTKHTLEALQASVLIEKRQSNGLIYVSEITEIIQTELLSKGSKLTSMIFSLDPETGPRALPTLLMCFFFGLLLSAFQSTKALSFLNRSLWNLFCFE